MHCFEQGLLNDERKRGKILNEVAVMMRWFYYEPRLEDINVLQNFEQLFDNFYIPYILFRLINATERLAENAPLNNGSFSYVAKNIEIETQVITPQSLDEGVTYVANSSQQNSSSPMQPQINITAKAFQEAKQQGSNRVVAIFYQNSKLFPVFIDTQQSKNKRRDDNGDMVLSGKFKDVSINMVEEAVELSFPQGRKNGNFSPRCVFWNFAANGICLIT